MAHKPHPLDIFRSSEQGFDAASRSPRKRRTVSGKVVRSVARANAGSAASAKHSAPSRPASTARATRGNARGGAAKRTPAARGKSTQLVSNSALLWTAMVVVGAVGLWLAFGPDSAPVRPTLKAAGDGFEDVFSARSEAPANADNAAPAAKPAAEATPPAAQPTAPVSSDMTILAATYAGSAVSTAQAAAAELDARGFEGVSLVGYPGEEGQFGTIELIVGRAPDRDGLTAQLVKLRSIHDWGTGRESSPFHDARFVAHPLVDG